MIKQKWLCYLYIILGIIIAASNTILFLGYDRTVIQALFALAGLGFVYTGVSNLRRLQRTGEPS